MEANPNILAGIDISFLLNPTAGDDNDDEAPTNPTADQPAHSNTTTPTSAARQTLPQPEAIQLREAVSKATREWLDQRPVFDGNKDDPRETAYYFNWEPK